jgi:hypothetical protein
MSTHRTVEERADAATRAYTGSWGYDHYRSQLSEAIQHEFADVVETDERVRELVAAVEDFILWEDAVARDGRKDIRKINEKEKAIERLAKAVLPLRNKKKK